MREIKTIVRRERVADELGAAHERDGDGKIFVVRVEEAVKVLSGEEGAQVF